MNDKKEPQCGIRYAKDGGIETYDLITGEVISEIITRRIYERETEYDYCFETYVEEEDEDTACYWLVAKDLSNIGAVLE